MASRRVLSTIPMGIHRWRSVVLADKRANTTPMLLLVRHAGHAKWQNIAAQKGASDAKRGQNASHMVRKVKAAIRDGGGSDPSKNSILAAAMEEAKKKEVGKSVAEYLKKVNNRGEMKSIDLAFRGPNNSIVIVRGSTDRPSIFRDDIVALKKRTLLGFNEDTSGRAYTAFSARAELKVLLRDEAGAEVFSMDRAEELAIECEAEEVEQVNDEAFGDYYRFITTPEDMFKVKKALVKEGVTVEDLSTVYHPLMYTEVDDSFKPKLDKFFEGVFTFDDAEQIFTNVTGMS